MEDRGIAARISRGDDAPLSISLTERAEKLTVRETERERERERELIRPEAFIVASNFLKLRFILDPSVANDGERNKDREIDRDPVRQAARMEEENIRPYGKAHSFDSPSKAISAPGLIGIGRETLTLVVALNILPVRNVRCTCFNVTLNLYMSN